MLTHSLGPYVFTGMKGTPIFPAARIDVEDRAAVDGVLLWDTGVKPEPFEVATEAACLTYADALTLCLEYSAASRLGPLPLVMGSEPISGGNFQVLHVQYEAKASITHIPGDTTTYRGMAMARWTLLAIADI